MLIIHPQDSTTAFLRTIYETAEGVTCLSGNESRKALASMLFHLPAGTTIMLLGHGSGDGLFRKENREYRCYVGQPMAYSLRRHPVIGIWCHANQFAVRLRLHGLFTGMFISEMEEAEAYGVKTTEDEIGRENERFASILRQVLNEGGCFARMKERIIQLGAPSTDLTRFNYNSLYVM